MRAAGARRAHPGAAPWAGAAPQGCTLGWLPQAGRGLGARRRQRQPAQAPAPRRRQRQPAQATAAPPPRASHSGPRSAQGQAHCGPACGAAGAVLAAQPAAHAVGRRAGGAAAAHRHQRHHLLRVRRGREREGAARGREGADRGRLLLLGGHAGRPASPAGGGEHPRRDRSVPLTQPPPLPPPKKQTHANTHPNLLRSAVLMNSLGSARSRALLNAVLVVRRWAAAGPLAGRDTAGASRDAARAGALRSPAFRPPPRHPRRRPAPAASARVWSTWWARL